MILEQLERRKITSTGTTTITSIDFEVLKLRNAIRDLKEFAYRHQGVDAELDKALRAHRLRLQKRLDGAELHQIDAARGNRQAKLKIIDEPD